MPAIVGILTFISMINTTPERLKAITLFICLEIQCSVELSTNFLYPRAWPRAKWHFTLPAGICLLLRSRAATMLTKQIKPIDTGILQGKGVYDNHTLKTNPLHREEETTRGIKKTIKVI